MKILVDEMPIFNDDCIFADTCWENGKWRNYCQLGADGVSDCDLENGECSFLKALKRE